MNENDECGETTTSSSKTAVVGMAATDYRVVRRYGMGGSILRQFHENSLRLFL